MALASRSLTRHKPKPLQLSSTNFPTPNRAGANCIKPDLPGLPRPPATQDSTSSVTVNLLLSSLTPSEDLVKAAKDLVDRVSRKACIASRIRTGGAKLPRINLHVLIFFAASGTMTTETAAHLKALRTIPHINLEIFPARWTPSSGASQIFRALHTGKLGKIAHTFSQISVVLPPAAIRQNLPSQCRKVVDDCAECSAHRHSFEFLTNFVNVISHLLCSHLALSNATRFRYKPSLGRPAINIYLALDRPVTLHDSRDASESKEKDIFDEAVQIAQHSSSVLMINATRCFGSPGQDGSEHKSASQETCHEICESTKRNASMKLIPRERGRINCSRPHTADASKRGVLPAAIPWASKTSNYNLLKPTEPTLPTMRSSHLRFEESTSSEKQQRIPQVLRTAPGAASLSLVVRLDCGIDVRVAELGTLSRFTNGRREIPCLSQLSQHAANCSLDGTDGRNVPDSLLASNQAFLLSPQPRSIQRDTIVSHRNAREQDREQGPLCNRVKSVRPRTAPDSRLSLPLKSEYNSTASREPRTLTSTMVEPDSRPGDIQRPKNLAGFILSNPMANTEMNQKQKQSPVVPAGLVIRPRPTSPGGLDNSRLHDPLQPEKPHYCLGSERRPVSVTAHPSNSAKAGIRSKCAMQKGQNQLPHYVKSTVLQSRSPRANSRMCTQEGIDQRTGTQSTEAHFTEDRPVDFQIVITKSEDKSPIIPTVGCDSQRLVTKEQKGPRKLCPNVNLTLFENPTIFKTSSEFGSSPEPSPGSLMPWGVSADSFPLPPTSLRPTEVNNDRLVPSKRVVGRKSMGTLDLLIKNHCLNGIIQSSSPTSIEKDIQPPRLSEKSRKRPATSLGWNNQCQPPCFSHKLENRVSKAEGLHAQIRPLLLAQMSRDRLSASSESEKQKVRLVLSHTPKERSSTSLGSSAKSSVANEPTSCSHSPNQRLPSAETTNQSQALETEVRREYPPKHHSSLEDCTKTTKVKSVTEREEEGERVRQQRALAGLALGGRSDRANPHQSNGHDTCPSATRDPRASRPSTAPADKVLKLFEQSLTTEQGHRESSKHRENEKSDVTYPLTGNQPLNIEKRHHPNIPTTQQITIKSSFAPREEKPKFSGRLKLVSHFKSPSASEVLTQCPTWVQNNPESGRNALEILSESADLTKKNARVTPSLDLSGISIFSDHLDEALDLEADAMRYWW